MPACERSLRSVGLLCWESFRGLESLMRACVQIPGATWLYFWCSTAVGLRLTYPVCEIYWNGQPAVQIVGAGFLDRSVPEQVDEWQGKSTNSMRFLHFYSHMHGHIPFL
uniref:Uncharacterized protein n=1 Tax=Aegilops tauschii subsp. strangulata TaxID=200361 RepID=A0A453PMM1_AEGTS